MSAVLVRQQARDVVFVHWAVRPAEVLGLLPVGVEPDVLDGRTYVGLVAVRNHAMRLAGLPALPRISSYPQVNVRLYGRDRRGRRGVVFLSMEAARALPAWTGRWGLGLPYAWRGVRFARHGDVVEYQPRVAVRVGDPAAPDPVAGFVTTPPGLFLARLGRLLWIGNDHPAWPLRQAQLVRLEAPDGSVVPRRRPDSVLYSPGVPMTLHAPERD